MGIFNQKTETITFSIMKEHLFVWAAILVTVPIMVVAKIVASLIYKINFERLLIQVPCIGSS